MSAKLTICIPIYNCAEFVGEALDSILSQINDEVEIVVYDGGSTDSTSVLMQAYVNAWPNLHYHRGASRGGIDADMATCVSFATGEYCWLFSGDDVMRVNAISLALVEILSGKDVYICKHTICSKSMKILHEHPVLNFDGPYESNFLDSDQRAEWFSKAATTEAFFSFISGLIVHREKWNSGRLIPEFNGSCWGHVARLFEISKAGLKVKYVSEIWLDQRGDNDSFADKGVVNRFRIAIEGYHKIANHFFGINSIEAFHIRRVIRSEFRLSSLLSAKIQTKRNPELESKALLDNLVKMAYSDKSFANFMVNILYTTFPYMFFVVARFFFRSFKKIKMKIRNV